MMDPKMDNAGGSPELQQLLRNFLDIQHRRASVYTLWHKGFVQYMETSSDDVFNKLCSGVTVEFSECSRQVKDIIACLKGGNVSREDLASVLEAVQIQESQKLRMTSVLQVLRKAGRPSERASIAEHSKGSSNVCSHGVHFETGGLEMAQLEAEFDAALKEATGSVQDAILVINEHMEEIRYEIEELEQTEADNLSKMSLT